MSGEFELIDMLKKKFKLDKVGDDCAVLPFGEVDLLVTSDMLVEGVDFRFDWAPWESVGYKALAVSLSDIAAMGGEPRWGMLSIAVPAGHWSDENIAQLYAGWHGLGRESDVELIGGDISRADGPLVIDSTVIGTVPSGRAVMRSSAQPGDSIFVTGYLGGAAGGLRILEEGLDPTANLSAARRHLALRQLKPIPQVRTGKMLQTHDLATAMLDISDGLSSELHHIAHASSVGCLINADAIPWDPALTELGLDHRARLELALNGGEDFELLLTAAPGNVEALRDLGFHEIGSVTDRPGIVEINDDARISILPRGGYVHF